jgi:deazaflavin-dependent oxidoreductase (nitroreductase family)
LEGRAGERDRLSVAPLRAARVAIPSRATVACAGVATPPGIRRATSAMDRADPGTAAVPAGGREGPPARGATVERAAARLLRALVSAGLTPASWPGGGWGTVLLEVRGRRTGALRSTLVTWVEHEAGRYLVSMAGPEPRWVRNVRAAGGEAVLRHGGQRLAVLLEEVPAERRAPVLQAWYRRTARSPVPRRHFALDRGAPLERFERVAAEHPAFRIRPRSAGGRVTRDVHPSAMERLLADPPRATVAFVDGDRVDLLPARVAARAGMHLFGVRDDGSPPLDGREVVLVADGGTYWFELRGLSVRGTARPADAPPPGHHQGLRWYAVEPGRVLAWDYTALREE